MRELTIAGRRIADDEPAYVIAEIGNNHQGSIDTALRMIEAASRAGCDAVKFQKRDVDTLYSRALLDKPYDNPASFGKTYGEHRRALELPISVYSQLSHAAHRAGLGFIATAFDEPSASALNSHIDALKLASGALTDTALLTHARVVNAPIILSTGGGGWREFRDAVTVLWGRQFALLHCTAAYPASFDSLNLRAIGEMRTLLPSTVIGYSGHDNGIAMSMVAYALGARIIEKHFTLNRTMKGTDHAFSLEPAGMTKLCRDLKRAHAAMGDGVKRWHESERAPIAKMRRVMTPDGLKITGEIDAIA